MNFWVVGFGVVCIGLMGVMASLRIIFLKFLNKL